MMSVTGLCATGARKACDLSHWKPVLSSSVFGGQKGCLVNDICKSVHGTLNELPR